MTVRVSKPAFNLRSKLNELDRPVGTFGNQVLATENRYDASKLIGSGRKNVLINGDFKISQRGDYTSSTAVTDDNYYLDRWKMRENTIAITIQHNKNISITEAGGIKTNSIKIDITSSNNGYWAIRQIVEDYAAVSGQTVTFSCWVRGVGPNVFFRLWSRTNIGHGHALTEDWQFYTETFSVGDVTQAVDGANGCVVSLTNYAGGAVYNHTSDWCEIALFQVEIGRSPTPFEFRTYAEELALCKRYYEQVLLRGIASGGYSTASGGYNDHLLSVAYSVEKRANPTLTYDSVTNYQPGGGSGTPSTLYAHTQVLNIKTGSQNSTFSPQVINSNAYAYADAEL